jgi:hypothetical protein
MDRKIAEPAIILLIREIRARLDQALTTAKAAEACADAGNCDQAARITLAIDQPVYEVGRLCDAASLINRISSEA